MQVQYHSEVVDVFIETYGAHYAGLKALKHTDNYAESLARNLAV